MLLATTPHIYPVLHTSQITYKKKRAAPNKPIDAINRLQKNGFAAQPYRGLVLPAPPGGGAFTEDQCTSSVLRSSYGAEGMSRHDVDHANHRARNGPMEKANV
jgi:hypothetical protein